MWVLLDICLVLKPIFMGLVLVSDAFGLGPVLVLDWDDLDFISRPVKTVP